MLFRSRSTTHVAWLSLSAALLAGCGPTSTSMSDAAMADDGPTGDGPSGMTPADATAAPDVAPPEDAPATDTATRPPRFEGLPLTCWRSSDATCNPANNDGCSPGQTCDLTRDAAGAITIACVVVDATESLGAACNYRGGPFCAPGLRCMTGRCADTCCSDAECTVAGERCVPLDPSLGTLGVCSAPSTCGRAGARCSRPSDCCSNDCHGDHCH